MRTLIEYNEYNIKSVTLETEIREDDYRWEKI